MKKSLMDLRNEKKLTQADMAEMLGIAVSTYNTYENGQRKVPENIAANIAKILGVKKEDIFLPATFTLRKTEQAS